MIDSQVLLPLLRRWYDRQAGPGSAGNQVILGGHPSPVLTWLNRFLAGQAEILTAFAGSAQRLVTRRLPTRSVLQAGILRPVALAGSAYRLVTRWLPTRSVLQAGILRLVALAGSAQRLVMGWLPTRSTLQGVILRLVALAGSAQRSVKRWLLTGSLLRGLAGRVVQVQRQAISLTRLKWPILLLLAGTPPALVVAGRWGNKPDLLHQHVTLPLDWGWIQPVSLPVFPLAALGCILLVWTLVWSDRTRLRDQVRLADHTIHDPGLSASRTGWASLALLALSLAGLGTAVSRILTTGQLPGLDLAFALAAWGMSAVLARPDAPCLAARIRREAPLWLAMLLNHAALIFLLSRLNTPWRSIGLAAWLAAGLLVVSLLPLWALYRTGRAAPPAFWLAQLLLLAGGVQLNHWRYAAIGDEYAFYENARSILKGDGLYVGLRDIFRGAWVYGSHAYLSTWLQALSMRLIGINTFGWRLSGLYPAVLAIPLFYSFWKRFAGQRLAFIATFLLAASHYLIVFGRIGYNNLHALLGLALVLWTAGRVVSAPGRRESWVTAGLACAFCFYGFPAALFAVPVSFFLLVGFASLLRRKDWAGWGWLLASLFLAIWPLFFQAEYWQSKLPGLFLSNPGLAGDLGAAVLHILANLWQAFISFFWLSGESHFVFSSFVDPLTGGLVIVGMGVALAMLVRQRFLLFWLASAVWMLAAVGGTHASSTPPVTRMFMQLPFLALFAALGIEALSQRLFGWLRPGRVSRVLPWLALGGVLALNLFQAYGRPNTFEIEHDARTEQLFLRLVSQAELSFPGERLTYLVFVGPNWGVDGLHQQQEAYGVPASPDLIAPVLIDPEQSDPPDLALATQPDAVVVLHNSIPTDLRPAVEDRLLDMGRVRCRVGGSDEENPEQVLWLMPEHTCLCPPAFDAPR